jgi:hypothetical protein
VWDCERHRGPTGHAGSGGNLGLGGTEGKLGEGRDLGGLRVGSRTHFSVEHLGESGSLRR